MAVNGIEIAVGQRWITRGAGVATVKERLNDGAFYVTSEGANWNTGRTGRYAGVANHARDLVSLIDAATSVSEQIGFDYSRILNFFKPERAETVLSAPAILDAAAGHMRDRAATYDKPEGERSMAQTVDIFNKFHGTSISETQGWHFMQILKDVRLFANVAEPHRDSIDDGVAYAALKGESLLRGAKS